MSRPVFVGDVRGECVKKQMLGVLAKLMRNLLHIGGGKSITRSSDGQRTALLRQLLVDNFTKYFDKSARVAATIGRSATSRDEVKKCVTDLPILVQTLTAVLEQALCTMVRDHYSCMYMKCDVQ